MSPLFSRSHRGILVVCFCVERNDDDDDDKDHDDNGDDDDDDHDADVNCIEESLAFIFVTFKQCSI